MYFMTLRACSYCGKKKNEKFMRKIPLVNKCVSNTDAYITSSISSVKQQSGSSILKRARKPGLKSFNCKTQHSQIRMKINSAINITTVLCICICARCFSFAQFTRRRLSFKHTTHHNIPTTVKMMVMV